jgi:hypothetical protein
MVAVMNSSTHASIALRGVSALSGWMWLAVWTAMMVCFAVRTGLADPIENAPIVFTEVTTEAGIESVETIGDHEMTNIVESAGAGCGFLDYDNDGWLDIYLVNGCWQKGLSDPMLDPQERTKLASVTDRLYRNRGDGTFEDVTRQAGLAKPAYGMGVIAADYDGDGDKDLYVTNYGPNFLYRNNGDGTFTDVAVSAGVDSPGFSVGAAFFDYDNDGRLDLYVGHYVDYDPEYQLFYAPDGFPGPLAYAGQQDRLFRGKPDGTFTDVTMTSGIAVDPIGRAMGVGAFDYNRDGHIDLFVSNDAMENFLFRNTGDGTFVNEAWESGVALGENGEATAAMGVEIADYDGDSLLDVFVPDMTFTCLYRGVSKQGFEDRAGRSGLSPVMGQYVGWGGVFADFNMDGVLDLFISNGDVDHLEPHEDVVFAGDAGSENGRFIDVSETAGAYMKKKYVGRGVAGGDFDNDGDIDILITNLNDPPVLLRNDTPRHNKHWLIVDLIGRGANRDAIGAVVTVHVGARTLTSLRRSGGGYLSQHDLRLHFGLGEHDKIKMLEVLWPDGTRQDIPNVRADQTLVIRQQTNVGREAKGNGKGTDERR